MSNNQPGEQESDKKPKSVKDMILNSLKPRSGRETSMWLANLTQETKDAVSQQETGRMPMSAREVQQQQATVKLVDELFDRFQNYAYEFNKSVSATELEVGWERPTVVTEVIRTSKWRDPDSTIEYFKGRLYTKHFSLVLRGVKNRIDGYIVPEEALIEFSARQERFEPLLEMYSEWDKRELVWTTNGGALGNDEIATLAKHLFGILIRAARRENMLMREVAYRPKSLASGKTSSSSAAAARDQSWQEIDKLEQIKRKAEDYARSQEPTTQDAACHPAQVELLKPDYVMPPLESSPQAAAPEHLLADPAIALQTDDSPAPFDAEAEPVVPPSSCSEAVKAVTESWERLQQQVKSVYEEREPYEAFAQPAAPVPAGAIGEDEAMLEIKEMSLPAACDALVRAIEHELESLTKAGAQAFEAQDFSRVEQTLKRTTKVKAYRDKIVPLLHEWKADLAQD